MATIEQLAEAAGLDESGGRALSAYVEAVLDWRAGNVTGLVRREQIVDTLLGDSLALLAIEAVATAGAAPGPPWLDLGSGVGVPGLPLAVALPAVRLTLLDSVGKKCAFLRHAVAAIGVGERVGVVCSRSEEYATRGDAREAHRIVLARAVGPPAAVAELAAPLLMLGGHLVVCTSAARAQGEWEAAIPAVERCGLALTRTEPLARSPLARSVAVVLEKTAPAPVWLPRRPGVARRRPLGG